MGNQQQNGQNFNHKDWTQVSSPQPSLVTLWQNNHNRNIHIEEHRIYTLDQDEFSHERQFYFERKSHPYWVAAYYFEQEKSSQICVNRSVAHIYIEKIPIKIFDLRNLPVPDLIHAYNQCLQGFKTLARSLGCFRVGSEYIGVNQRGIVKVWAGSQWAQVGSLGSRIPQQQMVKSVIESLQSCNESTVNQYIPISIKNYLYRHTDRLTFELAIQQLRNFALDFNQGIIPNRLESLYHAQNFQMFLDPLLRSNHHLQQSKHNSHPQSTNAQLYNTKHKGEATFRQLDSADKQYAFATHEIKQFREEERKQNKSGSFTFFSCMNDEEKLKTSKLLTNQEALNLFTGNPQNTSQSQQQMQQNIHTQTNTQTNMHNQPKFVSIQGQPGTFHSRHSAQNNVYITAVSSQHHPIISDNKPPQARTLVQAPSLPTLVSSVHFQHLTLSTAPQIQNNRNNNQMPFHPVINYYPPPFQGYLVNPVPNQGYSLPLNQGPPPVSQNYVKQGQNQTQRRNRPIPESIIMQLYTSQDKFPGGAESPLPSLKSFGLVKQAVSEVQLPQNQARFDSATLIKDGQPTSLAGVPNHNFVPNTNTNLQSILELSSEHWKNDLSYTSTPSRPPSELPRESQLKKYDYSKIRSKSNSNYFLDPNDGKTPDQFLKNIKDSRNYQPQEVQPQKLFR